MSVVSVLTYKSIDHLLSDGGSQSWKANRRRLRKAEYVVCARHAHGPYKAEGREAHKHAFLIGKISDVVDEDLGRGRHEEGRSPRNKILFSEYALIDGPELPLSGQNPVQYWDDLEALGIDESRLKWHETPEPTVLSPMDRAKAIVAEAHGTTPDKVEITIRF